MSRCRGAHTCHLIPCLCGSVCAKAFSFIPLSQHTGKGLQPLFAMETHVCPSLWLSLTTERQLLVSQPRITHSGFDRHACESTETHEGRSLCLQLLSTASLAKLVPERNNSIPQKSWFSAPLTLCNDITKILVNRENVKNIPSFLEFSHYVFSS